MTGYELFINIFWGLFLATIITWIVVVSAIYRLEKLEDTNEAK